MQLGYSVKILSCKSTLVAFVRPEPTGASIKEWSTSKTIVAVGFDPMQVVVALRGGELVYFQMDIHDGKSVNREAGDGKRSCLP